MKIEVSKERLFRELDKGLVPSGPLSRVTLPAKEGFTGRRREDRFYFWYRGTGVFSLFAPTLYGKAEGDVISVTVSYSRPLLFVWYLWSAFFLVAGILSMLSEPLGALSFLLPGIFLLALSFYHPKKKKERLISYLRSLT